MQGGAQLTSKHINRVELFLERQIPSTIIYYLSIVALCGLYYKYNKQDTLLIYPVIGGLVATLARIIICKFSGRLGDQNYERLYAVITAYSGLVLGLTSVYLFHTTEDTAWKTVALLYIVGMSSGAAMTFSLSPLCFHTYLAGAFGTVILYLVFLDSVVYQYVGVLGFVLYAFMSISARHSYKSFMQLQGLSSRFLESAKVQALGRLAGGLAHEVNNPLSIIMGQFRLLEIMADRNKMDPDKVQEIASVGMQSVERINHLVQAIRSYAGEFKGKKKVVLNVKDVVSEAILFTSNQPHYAGIKVEQTIDTSYLSIAGIKSDLIQSLMNMMANSADSIRGQRHAWIHIGVRNKNGMIVIEISDSGSGVSPEVAAKMFDPFFTSKPVGKGTGLGLSVAASIANDHGGEVIYVPNSKNTTFELHLPILEGLTDIDEAA